MTYRRSGLRWLAVLLLLSLFAAACGDSGGDETSDTDTTGATDSGSEDLEPVKVKFLPSTETLGVLPFLQALAEDYFTEEGVDLDYQAVLSNAGQVVQTVATGGADMAHAGSFGLYAAVAQDIDVVSVAYIGSVTLSIVLTEDALERLEAEGVTVDSPIEERVKALEGSTLAAAAAGSYADLVLRQTLREYGLEPDKDVTIQPIADSTAIATSAREGGLDGYIASPPITELGPVEGWGQTWISYARGDVPAYEGLPQFDLVVSRSYADKNAEAVERMIRALQRGLEDIMDDPEAVRAGIKARFYPDLDQEIFDRAFDSVLPAFSGLEPSEDGFEQALQIFNSGRPDAAEILFDDFYVLGPLRAALG